ncbi:hypothetical protein ACOMHN_064075 [Nucella lapillus]
MQTMTDSATIPPSVKQQWADADYDRQSNYPTICETQPKHMKASPLSATGSPPAKRRHLSPRTTPHHHHPSQPRFTPTPNKASPTSARLLRHNSRK